MNILLRVYFFGGLIMITMSMILFLIVSPLFIEYISVSKWALLGIMISGVPIILAIEGFMVQKGWIKGIGRNESEGLKKFGAFVKAPLAKSFVIAIFMNVVAGLIILILYGDEVYVELIVKNIASFIFLIMVFAFILSMISGKVRLDR